jgi:hypothetical protein
MTTIENLDYMRAMAFELEKMASNCGVKSLAYIFGIAEIEAQLLLNEQVRESADGRSIVAGGATNLHVRLDA